MFSRAIFSKSARVCGWTDCDEIVLVGPIPPVFFKELDGDGISTGSLSALWSKSKRFLLVKAAELGWSFFALTPDGAASIGFPAMVILSAGEGGCCAFE